MSETRRWLLTFALALAAAGVAAEPAPLRAGVGRAEITPPVGTPLAGYSDRRGAASTGVRDAVWAKALALAAGDREIVIATVDLCGIAPEMRQAVAQKAGIAPEQLLLCASHTHSGPGAYGRGAFASAVLGAYDERIYQLLVERTAAAVRQARERHVPARFGHGSTDLPGYSRNRRGGSVVNTALHVLRIDTAAGEPLAVLFQYATHGTLLGADNLEVSGDWMGAAQRAIEAAIPGVTALYVNGAEGDQAPRPPEGTRGFEAVEAMGRAIGDAVVALRRQIATADRLTIAVREQPLALPPSTMALLAGLTPGQAPLQLVRLGDVGLIAIPGEMIAELGQRIEAHARRQGVRHPIVVGLANDHHGYFVTEAEHRKGGYEAQLSFYGPRFGEQLAEAAMRLVGGEPPPPPPPPADAEIVRQWFAALPRLLRRNVPATFRADYHFVIEGAGSWRVSFAEGRASVRPMAATEGSGVVLRASVATWAALLRRERSWRQELTDERVTVSGDLTLALRLPELVRFRVPEEGTR